MELLSNYKTKLLNADEKDSDNDYKSETSMATSTIGDMDYNDLFGNPEVMTRSGAPVKGRKYLFFTVVMCIVLSIMVVLNSGSDEFAEAAEQQIKEQQEAPQGINISGDGKEGDEKTEGEQKDETETTTTEDGTEGETEGGSEE